MLAHANSCSYCVADKSLSITTCTMNKESLSQILIIRFHDSIINSLLLRVETFQTILDLGSKNIMIIVKLLMKDEIGSEFTPVSESRQRHLCNLSQPLSTFHKVLIQKIEAIVMYELWIRIRVIWIHL